jgi:hypothetical protein
MQAWQLLQVALHTVKRPAPPGRATCRPGTPGRIHWTSTWMKTLILIVHAWPLLQLASQLTSSRLLISPRRPQKHSSFQLPAVHQPLCLNRACLPAWPSTSARHWPWQQHFWAATHMACSTMVRPLSHNALSHALACTLDLESLPASQCSSAVICPLWLVCHGTSPGFSSCLSHGHACCLQAVPCSRTTVAVAAQPVQARPPWPTAASPATMLMLQRRCAQLPPLPLHVGRVSGPYKAQHARTGACI